MAPSHLAPRALNTTSSFNIGADVGNFLASSANWTCRPVSLSWNGAVSPVQISVVIGSTFPASFFDLAVVTPPDFDVVAEIGNFTAAYGDTTWTIPSSIAVGSEVALFARDGAGNVAISQIRSILQGGEGNDACQNIVAEPAQVQGITLASQTAGNWYRSSAVYPCVDVAVSYTGLSPPATLELFNANASANPPLSLFGPRAARRLANVTVIERLGTLNDSAGTFYWQIPSDFPLGSRVGMRATDSLGNMGLTEPRIIYPASVLTYRNDGVCRQSSESDRGGRNPNLDRPIVQFGLFLASAIALIFVVIAITFCCRRCRRNREPRVVRGPTGFQGPAQINVQRPVDAWYPTGTDDVALQTYRHRTEEEERLPPYERTPGVKGA